MNRKLISLSLLCMSLLGAAQAQTPPAVPAPAQAAPAPAAPPRPIPTANYVALGVFNYEQGKYDEAYVAFRAASELDPKNTDALLGLGLSAGYIGLATQLAREI